MKNDFTQVMQGKIRNRFVGLAAVLLMCLLFLPVQTVQAAEPVTTAVNIPSIMPNPAYIDQAVQVNVQVIAANPANGIPGGQVEIRSGQNRVCTITLDGAGAGSCTLTFDTPATIPLKAVYLGTTLFSPSVSTETSLVVLNKHTPVISIPSHLPDPSVLNQMVTVQVNATSDGPVPTGSITIWRSNSTCTAPPAASASDHCSVSLFGGAGSCSMPLTAPGVVYLCAAYEGDAYNFPAQAAPVDHFVSNSNTYTAVQAITPEPSLLNQTVWVSFEVGSPFGIPSPTDQVKVTSGSLSCTASIIEGGCSLTFTTPHLHDVYAAYQGGANQQVTLQPSTSRAFVHRVNAPPMNITLSRDQVSAFWTAGKEVAVISAVDPNPDETHRFSLVSGAGSQHNALFQINDDRLLLRSGIPSSLSSLSIRIRATDPAGLTFEKAFILKVESDAVLPDTGFAAGQITRLLPQPAEKRYQDLGSVTLEIPGLDVQAEITGVPSLDDGWDTDWLWNQVGWLNGTAFPGWEGNSVLAAHNYLSSGDPGPFAQLEKLRWGDKILVHAYGETQVYEVRGVETVRPKQSSILDHKDFPWLTLVTCKTFDETTGTYRWRVVVRAVLVDVQ